MRSFAFIALALMAGCRQVVVPDISVDVFCPVAEEPEEDTETSDTDADTDPEECVCEDVPPPGAPKLHVHYTNTFSAAMNIPVHAGQTVNMGGIFMMSLDSRPILVDQLGITFTVNDVLTPLSYYTAGHNGNAYAADYITGCEFRDAVTGYTYATGGVPAEDGSIIVDASGLVAGGYGAATVVNVYCTFGNVEPTDNVGDGFAMQHNIMEFRAAEAFEGEFAEVHNWGDNGTSWSPQMAAILLPTNPEPNECSREVRAWNGAYLIDTLRNTLWTVLSSSTPSGSAIPGRAEMLRTSFLVEDRECADLTVQYMRVKIMGTDNANSGWLSQMVDRGVWVYDLTHNGTTQTSMSVQGYYQDGDAVYVDLSGQFPVYAVDGTPTTIAIYADSTGASSSSDDAVRMSIVENTIVVTDGEKIITLGNSSVEGSTLYY